MTRAVQETQDMMSMSQSECWIRRCLGAGGLLGLMIIVSAALWGLLGAMGDFSGAVGARIVMWWSIWIWAVDFVALVVLVALRVLPQDDRVRPGSSIADGERARSSAE